MHRSLMLLAWPGLATTMLSGCLIKAPAIIMGGVGITATIDRRH